MIRKSSPIVMLLLTFWTEELGTLLTVANSIGLVTVITGGLLIT